MAVGDASDGHGVTSVDAEHVYATLMQHTSLAHLPPRQVVAHIGALVDVAYELRREDGLLRALEWADALDVMELPPDDARIYHYFTANAWVNLRHLREGSSSDVTQWDWEQREREQALIHYRRALPREGETSTLDTRRECQILTNLGNLYDTVGRFSEAIAYWGKALEVLPEFGMARASRGLGLTYYASAHYDRGQSVVMLRCALDDLRKGIGAGVDPHGAPHFEQAASDIEAQFAPGALKEQWNVDDHSLGETAEEVAYRRWVLGHGLFLNVLNDLGPISIAARDILHLPSVVVPIQQFAPVYYAFYNQMKQEFVSSRYLLYEGLTVESTHFSDRDVMLYNSLDYPSLSLNTEKLRLAFRAAYSLLDKVGYFLNWYLELGIPDRRVNFRSMWCHEGKPQRGLSPRFTQMRNWPLRGLFWLSKDLLTDSLDFREAIEPDAAELRSIRNSLEHKCLQVHDLGIPTAEHETQDDAHISHVSRADFGTKALRLMKMARAALLYLSLGVHTEERRREQERPDGAAVPPMPLDTIEDDWKR